jgi:death-on-curing protein
MTFDGQELYPSLIEKVAALGFSLVTNHAFVDGNKRIAHAAMETMLMLNGVELEASLDEQETFMLALAAGELERSDLQDWLDKNSRPVES